MVEIREMDEGYIFDRCPLGAPLDPFSLPKDEYLGYGERAREIRRRFFREVRAKYGNCVLYAWDKGKIVGFLIFLPKLVARKLGLGTSPEDSLIDETLVYVCMQVVPQYRNRGVGTELVNALIAWAQQKKWRRIEVRNVRKGDDAEDWRWGWGLPKWEKMGFRVFRRYEVALHNRRVQLFSLVLDVD